MTTPSPAILPPGDPNELARRLGLGTPAPATVALLIHCLETTSELLAPRVDPAKVAGAPRLWEEALYQLAVKVWDAGTKGLADMGPTGDFTVPGPAATSGLYRSVLGILGPVMPSGGVVIG